MRAQFEFVVAPEPNAAAKKAGPAVVLAVAAVIAVPAVHFFALPRIPNWFGMETLGSVRYADAAVGGVDLPPWHVVEATRAWLESPVRFDRVHLRTGQTLKIAYNADVASGGFRLSVYRVHGVLQNVADFESVRVEEGQARTDVITYIAPRDGVYVISRDVRPDAPNELWLSTLFKTYDVTYAVTWSIHRPLSETDPDQAADDVLPRLRR